MRSRMSYERETFERWMRIRGYSEKTVSEYSLGARRCNASIMYPLAAITLKDLEAWMETLPATPSSQALGRKSMRCFLDFAGVVPNLASSLELRPQVQGLPKPLSPDDHLQWIEAAHRLGGIFEELGLLMATSGARMSEVSEAQWADIDFSGATWRIRGKGSNRSGIRWRQLPLHPSVVILLKNRRTRLGGIYVFEEKGHPIGSNKLRAKVITIGEAAGLGHVIPHRIRHTVATSALSSCGDLRAVQELLGHASIQSTQIYTQVLPGRLSSLVDILPS